MSRTERAAKRARHGTRAPGNTALRVTAMVTAAVLGFGIVFGTTYVERLQHTFDTQDIGALVGLPSNVPSDTASPTQTPTATATADPDPVDSESGNDINILLIGSDSRAGDNGDIGGTRAGGMRSDTTMIMHIAADRSRIDFLSIPRDSRVKLSNCKMLDGKVKKGWTTKFNAAFSLPGPGHTVGEAAACTMTTIQDLTGITFDHYAVVDFAGFENMINSVGGVPMCIDKDIKSKKAHLNLKAGAQVLSGRTALAYSRARYGIGDGTDLMRIDRQHDLMNNLAKKVLGMNALTNAPQLTLLLKSAGESMTMDPALGSFTYLAGLAFSLRNIDQSNINFETVPWKYPGDKSGDVVWTPDAKVVFQRIVHDIPMDGATSETIDTPGSSTATPDISGSPAVSATPDRQTQDEILAACAAG